MIDAKLHAVSEDQARVVRDQLRDIVRSTAFAGSKRCQEFLEFVIERALVGDWNGLKERSIGADLFGRAVDYETATDPIVRVKANDVRRRLARYNLEFGAGSRVRIDLPPGSYVPEFLWPEPAVAAPADVIAVEETGSQVAMGDGRSSVRKRLLIAVVIFGGLALAVLRLAGGSKTPELDAFWQPALKADGPVLLCFGRTTSVWMSEDLERQIQEHPESVSLRQGDLIRYYDTTATAGNIRAALSITNLLQRYGEASSVQWASEVPPADLRSRTIVFIGAFNNPWTIDLNRDVRFIFEHERDQNGQLNWVIRDQKKAGRKWVLTKTFPQPIMRDYALLTRVFDRARDRVVISVGGMNHFGTQMAGEFLADPKFWRQLASNAPSGWEKKNIQVLLETEISASQPVRPNVIETYFW